MKMFLDSAKADEIRYALDLWDLDGVTTNPRHVKDSGKPFRSVIEEIAQLFSGTDKPVSVEVDPNLTDWEKMVDQGLELSKISPNFVIKVSVGEQGYKAIFLGTGAWTSQKLDIPGEDGEGVIYALDFLLQVNMGEKVKVGNKVAVIGGGSVALDAARMSLRLGADQVSIICLETTDLTSKDRMPAQELEIEQAGEERVTIHPSLGVTAIITEQGKISGLKTVNCLSPSIM